VEGRLPFVYYIQLSKLARRYFLLVLNRRYTLEGRCALHTSQTPASSGACQGLGTSAIIMVQSTQDRVGDDLATILMWWNNPIMWFGNLLPDALMRSDSIEVLNVGAQDPLKLLLMQDKQMIEALAPHTPQKTLTDGIRSWGVRRSCENLDATRLGNPREAHPKLAIVITDEILRSFAISGGFPKRYVQSTRRWDSA
jgi:hypothetical protein